jgi:hypothetical protein
LLASTDTLSDLLAHHLGLLGQIKRATIAELSMVLLARLLLRHFARLQRSTIADFLNIHRCLQSLSSELFHSSSVPGRLVPIDISLPLFLQHLGHVPFLCSCQLDSACLNPTALIIKRLFFDALFFCVLFHLLCLPTK